MERASGQARRTPLIIRVGPAPAARDRRFTYSCAECAQRLGKNTVWFREHLAELMESRGMPPPLDVPGQRRWDIPTFDAWRDGFKGPKDAANDTVAEHEPLSIEDHQHRLRLAYGGAR